MKGQRTSLSAVVCMAAALLAIPAFVVAQRVATVPLGPLQQPSRFDLAKEARYIDYGLDLTKQRYTIREPYGYSRDPQARFGLYVFASPQDEDEGISVLEGTLDSRMLFYLGCEGVGNNHPRSERMGAVILGIFRMQELFPNIDPERVYVGGMSGGGRTVSTLAELRPDVVRGVVGWVGASLPTAIPGWSCTGNQYGVSDDNYEVSIDRLEPQYRVFSGGPRIALITTHDDFRRTELVGIYRYGHMNHGNHIRLIVRPGGHNTYRPESLDDALRFIDEPLVDVIRDRFEDGNVDTNTESLAQFAVGSGIGDSSSGGAKVVETRTSYNGLSSGILRLETGPDGTQAIAMTRDGFNWNTKNGAIVDARLRAETADGLNQRIGLHIVSPDGSLPPEKKPGFHVTFGYGEKCNLAVVDGNGTAWPLAHWRFDGPHPMELPATDKLFFDFTTAPDYAGRALCFRGEDFRIFINEDGFQLTFSRLVTDVSTDYPGDSLLVFPKSRGFTPGDGEEYPIIIQGYWSDLQLRRAAMSLGSGPWSVALTNGGIDPSKPSGAALVDEIRVQAASSDYNPMTDSGEINITIHPGK